MLEFQSMNGYLIKVADPSDHNQLTEIAIESKRYWKYPEDWIQGWIGELTIRSDYIDANFVFKLISKVDKAICGFCALKWDPGKAELEVDHLWLKSAFIGKNLGKFLLQTSLENVEDLPIKRITVTADPNALGFYEKFGFVQVGYTKSTPRNRLLPNLVFDLS